MRIATAAYPLDWFDDWTAYADKLTDWVAGAKADLLVFPEYGAMELASLAGAQTAGNLEASLTAVSDLIPQVDDLHADLARRFGVHILAASAPVWEGARPVNRARFFAPSGARGFQDKQIMTRFEREQWDVVTGQGLTLFDTGLGKIGVLICYDAEFPLLGRALIEAGADLILCPSCTDAQAGYARVRIGAQARALEGQCVTVQAVTVGDAPWCPAVDENRGAAGIYGPPDHGFPAEGVLAQGALNAPGWVRADVDLGAISRVRADGQVLNMRHWQEQIPRVRSVTPSLLR